MNYLKEIKDFPGYFVSDVGDVYSYKYGTLKKRNTIVNKRTGYVLVVLCKNNKAQTKTVHRLVAQAFINNPDNKPEVNHKNGIRNDNRVENLEWATNSENQLHSFKILGRKPTWLGKCGKNNPRSKIIQQIKNGKIIAEFYGAREAEKLTGTCYVCIINCCNGKLKTAGKYQWKYK